MRYKLSKTSKARRPPPTNDVPVPVRRVLRPLGRPGRLLRQRKITEYLQNVEKKEAIASTSTSSPIISDPRAQIEKYPFHGDKRVNNKIFCKEDGTVDEEMTRHGSEYDVEAVKKLFQRLKLQCTLILDQTKKNILDGIDAFIEAIPKDTQLCFVAVFSHGQNGKILTKDQLQLDLEKELYTRFNNKNCKVLIEVPKLMLMQCCHGQLNDTGVVYCESPPTTSSQRTEEKKSAGWRKIPTFSNMFIMQSTIPLYKSYRDKNRGSWLVQSFCQVMKKHAHELELDMIWKLVEAKIERREESLELEDGSCIRVKLCTEQKSRLFKKRLDFNVKKEDSDN